MVSADMKNPLSHCCDKGRIDRGTTLIPALPDELQALILLYAQQTPAPTQKDYFFLQSRSSGVKFKVPKEP